jgi:hypothetical protein
MGQRGVGRVRAKARETDWWAVFGVGAFVAIAGYILILAAMPKA